jgi:hypothetical protein
MSEIATLTPPRDAVLEQRQEQTSPDASQAEDNKEVITSTNIASHKEEDKEDEAPPPAGPSRIEILQSSEAQDREDVGAQRDGAIAVAAIAAHVCVEEIERSAVIVEEANDWQALLDVAAAELEQALLLTNLHSELKSLEDEDEKLRVIIESQEVLLAFSKATSIDIAAHEAALDAEMPKLEKAKALLSVTTERLRLLPAKSHAALEASLAATEAAIGGVDDSATTREQLKEAWTAANSGADEPEQFEYKDAVSRCEKAHKHHEELCNTIDALFRNHEAAILELEANKADQMDELVSTYDVERKALEAPHKQLKQVENEQLFHIRRGTFIKERQTTVSHDELLAQRVKARHTSLCDGKLKAEKEIDFIGNEVRDLKRTLEDLKRVMEEDRNRAASKRHDFTDEQLQASRTRTLLEQEQEDLRVLKTDLTKVLQFVKLKNKSN